MQQHVRTIVEDHRPDAIFLVAGLVVAAIAVGLLVDVFRRRSVRKRESLKVEALEGRLRESIEAHVWSAETERHVRESLLSLAGGHVRTEDLILLRVYRNMLGEARTEIERTVAEIDDATRARSEPVVHAPIAPIAQRELKPANVLELVVEPETDPFPSPGLEDPPASQPRVRRIERAGRGPEILFVGAGGRPVPRARAGRAG